MSKLWDYLNNRLKKSGSKKAEQAFLHEAVDLKSYPMSDFLAWHSEKGHLDFTSEIRTAYNDYLITESSTHPKVDILVSPSSNGWIIRCQKLQAAPSSYKHFMFLLQQRLKKAKYIVNLSDIKSQQRGNSIETVYRYYLKPSIRQLMPSSKSKRASQIFGNITIELISRDGEPYLLKFLANNYTDQHYHEAEEFSDLMDIVCGE